MPETKDIFLDSISSTPSERPSGVNHLLVIAIDAYKHCPPLKSCVKDAKDFIQVLWEKYTFEKSHTYTLINEQATRANILNTIKQLRNKVKEKESLVIYYSGHGYIADDMGYWIPVDAASDDEVGFVSGADLKQRLDKINSFHTFLIVDACFSGALFLSFKNGVALTAAGEDKRSRWGLAASHSREKALDGTTGDNSPFAKELLRNLRISTENLSVLNLGSRIKDEVYKNSEQKQAPVFERLNIRGDDSGQFVFHLKPEEENRWENLKTNGTVAQCTSFLLDFPNSRFHQEVRLRIRVLEETQAWEESLRRNRISDFFDFIDKFPQSQFATLASQKIAALRLSTEEEDAWRQTKNEHSEMGYQRYIDRFPQGRYVVKAREELEEFQYKKQQHALREKEETAWSTARRTGTIAALEAFIRDFPRGSFHAEATGLLDSLKSQAAQQADQAAWDQARTQHTTASYEAYLSAQYTLHRAEATKALDMLVLQKEEDAWQTAKRSNTPEAYRAYLDAGYTRYQSEAERALTPRTGSYKWILIGIAILAILGLGAYQAGFFIDEKAVETEAFDRAYAANTIPAWTDFLEKFPDGANNQKAKERLKELNKELEENLMKAEAAKPIENNLVRVSGTTFTMGCTNEQRNCTSDEKLTHQVTLSDFYISKYEVTQKEWQVVMGSNPSSFKNCDNCPVEQVSWEDIQLFLARLMAKTGVNYRLPTEAEWEYAARGGASSRGYQYAGSNTLGEVAWFGDNASSKTHPVGQKRPNELGLYDMSGNVWEWCSDWYGIYPSAAQTNPQGSSVGSDRVLRGGSWVGIAGNCRVTFRLSNAPDYREFNLGFRLARTP